MTAFLTSWSLTDGIVQAWRDWCHVSAADPAIPVAAESSAKSVNDADLMLRRMAVLDLDAKKVKLLHPILFQGMRLACANCESRERCEQDLDYELNDRRWRKYCPNAETFRTLDAFPWYAASSAISKSAAGDGLHSHWCGRSP